MDKAKRMILILALLVVAVAAGLVAFWYVQTRNVEIARYAVVESDGSIEIRDYPALTVAEVTRTGSRDQAVRAGFGPLARYIFASDRAGDRIAMTAPVTQQQGGEAWTIQFIMPSGYTLASLPKPAGADVRLSEEPPVRRAAIRFSGWWNDALFAEKNAALQDWLRRKGLATSGPPIFAYYNDPFTPGFLRRNEILYDLAQK
ncbi:heme-binding protein [Aestuariivirga litoralis]|uniref:Heme-binding protein n=1 Tax=Aestuariivirga litoralis TaxID=2650924 RepID=A0A2W2BDH9_9HYPH|nr:heme-binding protein [Aestuariivirga litoralis]PZF78294.1 heme-binding protein [Aestuariivirga litoralis]